MKVGEKRKLTIPPAMAYGPQGRPPRHPAERDAGVRSRAPRHQSEVGALGARRSGTAVDGIAAARARNAVMTTPDVPATASAGAPEELPAPAAKAPVSRAGALPLSAPVAYVGALLSGILYWLAFPGIDAWPLAFVAWVPLLLAMHRQTPRRAMLLGWVAGTTMNVAGFWWLQGMLSTFSGFPAPLCFLFLLIVCAFQGGRIALQGWLYGRATARGWPHAPVFAAAFAASELLYPVLFLWYFAATVHQVPLLTQLGDVGGPIGVGLVLVAVNLALGEAALALLERRRASIPTLVTGAGVAAFACAYGAIRIRMVDAAAQAAPGATVGVVQANMGLAEKRSSYDEGLRRHLDLERPGAAAGRRFRRLERDLGHAPGARQLLRRGAPRRREPHRSARDLRRGGGQARSRRARVRPLQQRRRRATPRGRSPAATTSSTCSRSASTCPFGETFPILYRWSPNSGHFTPGTSLDPLTIDVHGEKHPVTTLICYEDILPRFTNDAVRHADPELLVNMTNDAWFGDTEAPWEHFALAQLRAVEHRRYFVRGTNSGVSAVVDPVGRVVAHTDTFRTEAFTAPIHWMRAHTMYERLGDWPWLLVAGGLIYSAFRRRHRTARPLDQAPVQAS